VRDRFIAIAQHYRSLAKIEQSIVDQWPTQKVNQAALQFAHDRGLLLALRSAWHQDMNMKL
jgi:hypothetical protein